MPALIATSFTGTITWLGQVADRKKALTAQPLSQLSVTFAGPEGEAHGGLTRAACSRVKQQYPRGTIIRNTRQLAIVSAEEMAEIAAAMGLESLDPGLLGSSMMIEGLPDFTHLPPSARLQGEGGATLVVDMENQSCQLPARPIETLYPGHGAAFRKAAKHRRGITAWVEREGVFRLGEKVGLHIPAQRHWTEFDLAAGGK